MSGTYGHYRTDGGRVHPDRHSTVVAIAAGAALVSAITGCAGNGEGLDQNGRPFTDTQAPLTAEFASIQARVLTPYCTGCHVGAAAPLGLRLTEDASYAAIVNAPSVERPALRRIAPGDPASSYLVQKISGTAAVGGRMPLGGPPLPADVIAAIEQWVRDGALPSRKIAASTVEAAPVRLSAVVPMDLARVTFDLGAVVVAAAAEIDSTTLGPANVSLTRSGGDGMFEDELDQPVEPVRIELRSIDPTIFAVTPPNGWVPDRYRLIVSGGGDLPVRDRATRAVDGDGDGRAGGDLIVEFDIANVGERQ